MTHRFFALLFFGLILSKSLAHSSPTQRPDPLLDSDNPTLPVKGVIFSKDIRMRDNPSITKTEVVDVLPFGTPVTIIERHGNKMSLMEHEGYWYKVTTQSGKTGWVFSKFLASEKSDLLREQAGKLLDKLYWARPQLGVVLEKVRKAQPTEIQSALEHVKPEAYNYLAYHLLLEGNSNALPVLMEYMNPSFKERHTKDPNYQYNWEILSRLIPNEFLDVNYQTFNKYWKDKGPAYRFPLSMADIFPMLVRIKYTEDRVLRGQKNAE